MNRSAVVANAVYVDKAECLEDIIDAIPQQYRPNSSLNSKSKQSVSTLDSTEIQKRLLREQLAIKAENQAALCKLNAQRTIERNKVEREERFAQNLSDVEESKSFLDTVDKSLGIYEETKKNKMRRQFEDWNKDVHGAINRNIAEQLNGMDAKTLNRKKNEEYSKFLDVTNRKPAIFRDIIIESEYDPLSPNRRCIKAKTKKLKDPTNVDVQKAEMEASMLGSDSNKLFKRGGRETLPVMSWASGKIEATPYGMFAKMMDGTNVAVRETPTTKSSVVFDHFNFPVGKEPLDCEMPRGKRIHPRKVMANLYQEGNKESFDETLIG